MMKEVDAFAKQKVERFNENLKLSKQLEAIQDELKELGYEEKVHQVEKNKEFGGACSNMVSNRFLSKNSLFKQLFLVH